MTKSVHNQKAEPEFFESSDGSRLTYIRHRGGTPGVVFLGGLRSSMQSTKARAVVAHCEKHGRECLRLDYRGHGASDGTFEEGTIGRWLQDVLDTLDTLTKGPQVLVGSSLGAWLALLATLKRPERVAGILGVSPAVDFTEHLYHTLLNDAQRTELREHGRFEVPDCHGGAPFAITSNLIAEARRYLLLPKPELDINVPVRLVHGQCDQDVPWRNSLEIAARLRSSDVQVLLIKDGRHELDRPNDIAACLGAMDEVIAVAAASLRRNS